MMLNKVALMTCLVLFPFHEANAATYQINGDIVGETTIYTVKNGDTLYDIARRHDLGIIELMDANPSVDTWLPLVGSNVIVPTMHILPFLHEGIVIDISELRLYYFVNSTTVMTFPIGIGKEGWPTPTGQTTIVKKRINPIWTPPASIRLETPDLPAHILPGPNNPMGAFALNLGWPSYAIHGTNRPYGVGRRSSHGCIRLYPEDIAVLFKQVAVGTVVTVIDRDENSLIEGLD